MSGGIVPEEFRVVPAVTLRSTHPSRPAHPLSRNRLGLSLLLLLLSLAACGPGAGHRDRTAPADLDHSRLAPVQLEGRVLPGSTSLALPSEIEVVGDRLVLIDAAADSVIHVLDRVDGRPVRSFGRRGGGPGEFEGAWSIDPVPGREGQFWVFDVALRRLTHVDLKRDFAGGARPGERSINLISDATLLDPVWVDTLLVGLGFFQAGRLGHFNSYGKFVRTVGELPPGDDDIPANIRQHAYQSTLKANPARSLLAVVTRHADQLEIYRTDGTLVARPAPLFGFMPRYEVRRKADRLAMTTGLDLRFGYIDVATTEDRIYALFSGRTRRGFPGAANYGEYVHVFDWAGGLRGVIRLDAAVIAIAVDPAGMHLYGVRHNPQPAVVDYALGASAWRDS